MLMAFLREVQAAGPGKSHLLEARGVASTEDIPARCYGAWYSAFVNTASSVDVMEAVDSTT